MIVINNERETEQSIVAIQCCVEKKGFTLLPYLVVLMYEMSISVNEPHLQNRSCFAGTV